MKKLQIFWIIAILLLSWTPSMSQNKKRELASKKFYPGEIWKDNNGVHINAHGGGILFYENKYYWFGEHKIEGEAGNVAHVGVHVYSSKDLYQWKDEGIALTVSNDPQSPIVKGCIIERPKVLYNKKTGKFVMWFHHELIGKGYETSLSGVAVADRVTGPYTYLGSMRPNAGVWPTNVPEEKKRTLSAAETDSLSKIKMWGGYIPDYPKDLLFRRDFTGGQMARDMTLFVDDDGKAYHIFSSEVNGTLHISQLTDDYLKPAGKFTRHFVAGFNEALAMFKHNGRYYMISSGCTSWDPNAARLAVADRIDGPWKELGNPCKGVNEKLGLGAEKTFGGQSTYVLPVRGRKDAYIAMFDLWNAKNAIDGRYAWLPVVFTDQGIKIEWKNEWDLNVWPKMK